MANTTSSTTTGKSLETAYPASTTTTTTTSDVPSKEKGKTVKVLKAFKFSWPGTATITDPATGKITQHAQGGYERDFLPGDEVEITPEMVDHPWILAGADGAVETEEQAKVRTSGKTPEPPPATVASPIAAPPK